MEKFDVFSIIINVIAILFAIIIYSNPDYGFKSIGYLINFLVLLYIITFLHSVYYNNFKSRLFIVSVDLFPIILVIAGIFISEYTRNPLKINEILVSVFLIYLIPILLITTLVQIINYVYIKIKHK